MFGKLHPTHLRTRLTVWYVSVLAGVLVLAWIVAASFLFLQMRGQIDRYAIQDVETIEGLLYFDAAGRLELREDYHNHPESKQVLERLVEVRSQQGGVLYRNERLGRQALDGNLLRGEGENGYSPRTAHLADGTAVRMVSRRHTLDGHAMVIRLGYSEAPIWERLREFAVDSLLSVPVVLVLVALSGFLLARRALAPLEEMAGRAREITSENLHERLPVGESGDELAQLAAVFNGLLARLEQSFEQLRRFTADASHELRTPLTSIRSVGEVALQKDGSREEYRDTIGSMLEEVNRLTALVDSLLTISRADAGRLQLHPTVFSAMDLAREATALFDVLIEEKGQRILLEGDEDLRVRADRVFLRQALINIVHNAVKFSPPEGLISVRIRENADGGICFEVADTGPGIPPEHAVKIFDRFYRADPSRSRDSGGAGLGLSIAQWAVRVHGGEIRLETAPGQGCRFQISLRGASRRREKCP